MRHASSTATVRTPTCKCARGDAAKLVVDGESVVMIVGSNTAVGCRVVLVVGKNPSFKRNMPIPVGSMWVDLVTTTVDLLVHFNNHQEQCIAKNWKIVLLSFNPKMWGWVRCIIILHFSFLI